MTGRRACWPPCPSGVWFDFFLTEPYLRLTIADSDDIETTVLLVLIGVAVTEIALWGHRQQAAPRGAPATSRASSALPGSSPRETHPHPA